MRTLTRNLKQITFLSFIFIITVAFNFQHNPQSNWYQQFLPDTEGQQIRDMTFTDSLNGYIVTAYKVLKTTNGGDNWVINYNSGSIVFNRIQFINSNTGFILGESFFKTTNAGLNWFTVGANIYSDDAWILNNDTAWYVDHESLTGGVYRTTNGGGNWQRQYSAGSNNPNKIHFVTKDLGFISNDSPPAVMHRTSNGGLNWTQVFNEAFSDMYFCDNLTGWKGGEYSGRIAKTTNSGINWFLQYLPPEGSPYIISRVRKIAGINKDTLWGSGSVYNYGGGRFRGMLYRSTNGGSSWQYQIPDTSFGLTGAYYFIKFLNSKTGWAYNYTRGIHTTLGGDTTFLTSINQTSTEIPKQYNLSQNYPNPFNPNTVISFKLQVSNFVTLKVFNLKGQEVALLVNEKKTAGTYAVYFDALKFNLSSGIYFYSLQTDNFKETKKMILVK